PGSSGAMRALGYSGAGTLDQSLPSVMEATARPSVAAGLADALATYQAMTVAGVGKRREAMGLLEDLIERNPGNLVAGQVLGAMLIEEGRVSEAIEALEDVLRRGAAGGETLQLMGLAYTRAGRPDDAVSVLERAALARPGDPEVERLLDEARAAAR
ncbi:MAG: tetratricopeptide repeat protein, partial [Planctomycetota bacterium]|nr:tetratricopeptide repeat protein [Planctomycetota bacterium]